MNVPYLAYAWPLGRATGLVVWTFLLMTATKPVEAIELIETTGNAFVTWFETNAAADRLAQAFATDASNFVISSVSLNLFAVDGNTRTFNLDVWSNTAGNLPSTSVANVVTGGAFASFSDQNFFQANGLSVTLQPSTNYWLVLTPANAQQIRWGQTDNLTGGFSGFANAVRRSTDSGSNWPDTTNLVQTRTRISAVPEPALLWVASLAVIGMVAGFRQFRARVDRSGVADSAGPSPFR